MRAPLPATAPSKPVGPCCDPPISHPSRVTPNTNMYIARRVDGSPDRRVFARAIVPAIETMVSQQVPTAMKVTAFDPVTSPTSSNQVPQGRRIPATASPYGGTRAETAAASPTAGSNGSCTKFRLSRQCRQQHRFGERVTVDLADEAAAADRRVLSADAALAVDVDRARMLR